MDQGSPRPDPWPLLLWVLLWESSKDWFQFWVPVSWTMPFPSLGWGCWGCGTPHLPLPWAHTFVPQVRGLGPLPLLLRALPGFLGAETPGPLPRGAGCGPCLRAQAHLWGVGVWSGLGPSPEPGKHWRGAPCDLGPTSLSEASGSSSLFDSGCCAWALLSSAGCRAWVRPGWWPRSLVEAGLILACQTRMSGNNSADEETEAQRGAVTCPGVQRPHNDPTSWVSPGLAAV